MDNLTDVYNQFSAIDDDLEKQASEMVKQAEEEEFAGRIMARGFADELNKLAAPQYGKIQGAGPDPRAGGTRMAEAPKQIDFSKSEGSKIKARPAAPKQTRAQAVGHAKGIANMAKGIGKGLGGNFGANKPPLVAGTK